MSISIIKIYFIFFVVSIILYACGSSTNDKNSIYNEYKGNKSPIVITNDNVHKVIENVLLNNIFNEDYAYYFFSISNNANSSDKIHNSLSKVTNKYKKLLSGNNVKDNPKSFNSNYMSEMEGIEIIYTGDTEQPDSKRIEFTDSPHIDYQTLSFYPMLTNAKINGFINYSLSNYMEFQMTTIVDSYGNYYDTIIMFWYPMTRYIEMEYEVVGQVIRTDNLFENNEIEVQIGDTLIFKVKAKFSNNDNWNATENVWKRIYIINSYESIELYSIEGIYHKEELLIHNLKDVWEETENDNGYIFTDTQSLNGNIYHSEWGKLSIITPVSFIIVDRTLTQGKMRFNDNLIIEVIDNNQIEVILDNEPVINPPITAQHFLFW